MSLDIYFKEDIASIIRATNMTGGDVLALVDVELKKASTSREVTEMLEHMEFYRRGFEAALSAVATAFGIIW